MIPCRVSNAVDSLANTSNNFRSGKIFTARQQWLALSSDPWILDVVCGHVLEFDELPLQCALPRPLSFSARDSAALDAALHRFVEQGIVERCEPSPGHAFYSNVFPTLKKDGTSARVILNLKELNPYVTHTHFKMDSFKDVVRLVQPQCYFMTIDFQDAYFSVYVRPEERCWLRFFWKGQCFHFTCLPQGLTSAPPDLY